MQTVTSGAVKLARAHRRHGRGVAAAGPAGQGRAGSGAAARRAVRGDHPRAEERRHSGRRRRPAGADRAHRGDGPDGAGRRAAAAGGRSGAGDRAQEPAVRPRRRRAVQARLGPQGQPARRRCARSGPNLPTRFDAMRAAARDRTPFAFYAWPARRRQRPAEDPGAARPRSQRRARRIPQSRARLRARRDAVAARLRRLAARGARPR